MKKANPRIRRVKTKARRITSDKELEEAFRIRHQVFVLEQKVDVAEEYDEFETISTHIIAHTDGQAVGTCRWRFTESGIKLERFAVLAEFRGTGVGSALIKAALESIVDDEEADGRLMYMHAQLAVVPFYEKFGFRKEGEEFMECGIRHCLMKRN